VDDGETLAIVGPSGSGKTTLLSLFGGLIAPSSGVVRWSDDRGAVRQPRDITTWVLQTVSLLPERTVMDNVKIGSYADGLSHDEAERRANGALSAMGLGTRGESDAALLSGGEAQRVAIARALASTRPVLLADEPTGQLDRITTAAVLDAMFSAADRTVILVTHDERAAQRCDRVLRLEREPMADRDAQPGAPR
jgi:putative ABC transport system ATP-binding protein/lipoprotein-releasing system ATP-binding protein